MKQIYKGMTFDSLHELRDYVSLEQLEYAGKIYNLERQVSYPLRGQGGTVICTYRADFRFNEDKPDGPLVVQDSKGCLTDVYKLKRKLMKDNYGITIRET